MSLNSFLILLVLCVMGVCIWAVTETTSEPPTPTYHCDYVTTHWECN